MKGTQGAEKKVELRIVDVIARYEEKRNGQLTGVVIYTVRPSERTLAVEPNTQDYRVVFFDGELQNCTCRGYREFGHCYHSAELAKREQPRAKNEELPMSSLHNSEPLHMVRGIPMR